jgi:hypothetical protein
MKKESMRHKGGAMKNKTVVDSLNDSSASSLNPAERTTVLSKRIHEALHEQPEDLPKMIEMLQTLEPLIDTLRATRLEKTLLKQKIEILTEIAASGGAIAYFNAMRTQMLQCIGA